MKLAGHEHVLRNVMARFSLKLEDQPLVWPAIGWQGNQEIPGPLLDGALDERIPSTFQPFTSCSQQQPQMPNSQVMVGLPVPMFLSNVGKASDCAPPNC